LPAVPTASIIRSSIIVFALEILSGKALALRHRLCTTNPKRERGKKRETSPVIAFADASGY
jgi:hypothetical protein